MEAPALQPYGERRAAVRDPFDNQWYRRRRRPDRALASVRRRAATASRRAAQRCACHGDRLEGQPGAATGRAASIPPARPSQRASTREGTP